MERPDFDRSMLATLGFPDDPEIDRIVGDFFDRLAGDLFVMEEQRSRRQHDDFHALSHRLKGAAATLGFLRLEAFFAEADPSDPASWKFRANDLAASARIAFDSAKSCETRS